MAAPQETASNPDTPKIRGKISPRVMEHYNRTPRFCQRSVQAAAAACLLPIGTPKEGREALETLEVAGLHRSAQQSGLVALLRRDEKLLADSEPIPVYIGIGVLHLLLSDFDVLALQLPNDSEEGIVLK